VLPYGYFLLAEFGKMAKSGPLCRSAFSSAKQALAFVAFALGALVAPMILSVIWPIESCCSDAESLEFEFFTN
jgi:hypothetical protein